MKKKRKQFVRAIMALFLSVVFTLNPFAILAQNISYSIQNQQTNEPRSLDRTELDELLSQLPEEGRAAFLVWKGD